ncbi:hypothetical protein D3C74_22090 [compost metagenome]
MPAPTHATVYIVWSFLLRVYQITGYARIRLHGSYGVHMGFIWGSYDAYLLLKSKLLDLRSPPYRLGCYHIITRSHGSHG